MESDEDYERDRSGIRLPHQKSPRRGWTAGRICYGAV